MKENYPRLNVLMHRLKTADYPVKVMNEIVYTIAANSNLTVTEIMNMASDVLDEHAEA